MLIGLMSLPNQVVYIQFHPIAYMVKLNIEMSMADLIVKTARNSEIDVMSASSSAGPFPDSKTVPSRFANTNTNTNSHDYVGGQGSTAHAGHAPESQMNNIRRDDIKGITRQTEVQVYRHDSDSDGLSLDDPPKQDAGLVDTHSNSLERPHSRHSDGSQIPLKDMPLHHSYPKYPS